MTVLADLVLALAVAAIWLACVGFSRLRAATDRMHAVSFVSAAAGGLVLLYAVLQDGASARAGKVLLLVVAALVSGAALAHATGRVARLRRRDVP